MLKGKGFTVPLILIFTSLFIALPILFWTLKTQDKTNIKGAATHIEDGTKSLKIKINSAQSTWEISAYACNSVEECTKSLNSEKKLDVVNGGIVKDYFVSFNHSEDWDKYEYIKIFVKSAWGAQGNSFYARSTNTVDGTRIEKVKVNNSEFNVGLIPTKNLRNGISYPLEFIDQI